ncbi:hypothetical protein HDU96_010696 [Phlyctochytrium bullatum]|nr:hypothetical protein HDU96_010696 [Phlyctochytrium bullatum]
MSSRFGSIATVTFSNGHVVPAVAYGTGTKWFAGVKANDRAEDAANPALVQSIVDALRAGVRHIDTAEMYGTELECGLAIAQFLKESGLKRSDIYLTTKVYANIDNIPLALDKSLERLGSAVEGYVDLYLIHSPFWDKAKESFEGAWKKMEACLESGKTKAIGVSNYRQVDFEELFKFAKHPPVCNQIEYNPYLQSRSLKTYSDAKGITTAAYAPLGPLTHFASHGTLQALTPKINEARTARGAPTLTEAQLLLLWSLRQKAIAVTTTAKVERMTEFFEVQMGALQLTDEEVAQVDALGEGVELRRFWVKEFAPPAEESK